MNQILPLQYCPIHNNQQLGYINAEPNQQQVLKCSFCIVDVDNTVNINSIIPIGQFFEENCLVINNWPVPKNKQLNKQLKHNLQILNQKTSEKEQIYSFFKNFRQQFIQKIDDLEQKFVEVVENAQKTRVEILKKYNQYSARENIRDIFLCQDLNFEQKNSLISEIINRQFTEQYNISQDFSKSFEELRIYNLIDFEVMNLNSNHILNKLSTIQSFLQKEDHLKIFPSISNQSLFQSTIPTENKTITSNQTLEKEVSVQDLQLFTASANQSQDKLSDYKINEIQRQKITKKSGSFKIELKIKQNEDNSKQLLTRHDELIDLLSESIENIQQFKFKSKIPIFLPQKNFTAIRFGLLTEKLDNQKINILKLGSLSSKNQIAWLLPEIDEKLLVETFSSFFIYDFLQNKLIHEPNLDHKCVNIIKLDNSLDQIEFYKIKQNILEIKCLKYLNRLIHFVNNNNNLYTYIYLTINKKSNKLIEFEETILDEEQTDFDWKDEFSKLYQYIKWE